MARKSRRNNNIIEKKQEMMTPEIITGPQLETGVYARLSVEKDSEETIQTQIEMLHQYVEEHGEYHLVDTYVDNGYTGTDFDRPGFIRMMEDVRTGKIQCIIVKDLSRFGRNFIETGYYIETIFPCLNVRLISINDEFDSSREEDRNSIVMPVKNMINEMYAKDASKKKVLAFEMQSKRGDATIARSIYGYTVDKKENQLKVNPETAPIVRAIFRWYQMGRGTGAIVKRLKMLDIMTPHAYKATHELDMAIPDTDRWTGDRVKTILVNQAYIGTTIYGKRKRAKYRNMPEHHTDPKDWVIHENTHESIIARPDFDEVQRIWNRASEKYKESVERGLARQMDIVDSFPQKVKCMECGMTMTYMRYTNFGQSHGIRKGFYYASERNQLWQLLDCVLETDCFIGLKRQLKQNYDNYVCGKIDESVFEENRAKTRQMFAYELKKRKIAICDVFLECYFNNNSSLDNDIILNNPQYPAVSNAETIRNIIQNSKIRYVVVNSRFVQKQFEKMKICGNFEVVYVVSPSPRKGSIESKLASWKMAFDQILNRNII